jgi:hypothetical protein
MKGTKENDNIYNKRNSETYSKELANNLYLLKI